MEPGKPAPKETLPSSEAQPAAEDADDLAAGLADEGEAPALAPHAAQAFGEKFRAAVDAEEAAVEAEEAQTDPRAETLVAVTGDDLEGTPWKPCPICDGFGAVDPDEALRRLGAIVEALAPFPQSTVFERCGECDGWGSVLTGARRDEAGIQPCPTCDGRGYNDTRAAAEPIQTAGAAWAPAPQDAWTGGDAMSRSPADGGEPPAVGMIWNDTEHTWTYPRPLA